MERILDFSKTLLRPHLHDNGLYLDFTMGNGYDTLFLAQHTHSAVYAFDIQQQALDATQKLLKQHQAENVRLILDSHEHFLNYITPPFDAGIFNLGYLPGGDKSVTTKSETTLRTLELAVEALKKGGLLLLTLYPGHEEGKEESISVEAFCRNLDGKKFDVLKYDFINKKHPPYILAIEKK